jgi:hypothetical protein
MTREDREQLDQALVEAIEASEALEQALRQALQALRKGQSQVALSFLSHARTECRLIWEEMQ